MKKLMYLTLLVLITSCSKSEDPTEAVALCAEKDYSEVFIAQPNDCFLFQDPAMNFTLVRFDNFTKSEFDQVPYATIWTRVVVDDGSSEFPRIIRDNPDIEGTSFSGSIIVGLNDRLYTVYIDEIEYTETDTEFIFHRATLRLEKVED